MTGLTGVAQVSAGSDFSCALPVPVVAGDTGSGNLTGAVFLASGTAYSCAVLGSTSNGRE